LKALWDWQRGDVLALYTPNSIDTPIITWGAHWAGGVISPANPAYTVEELAFQLKDSGAKGLVTQKAFLANAVAAAEKVGIPKDRVILIGDERDTLHKHFTSIVNISRSTRYVRTKAKNPATDLAFLVYSSGTTGHPKGVMLTHRNLVANILQIDKGEGNNLSATGGPNGDGDPILNFLPFFHIYGLTCVVHFALFRGLTTYVMAAFNLERFCAIIQEHRIAFAYAVPPVILQLAKNPIVDKYDLSSMRMMNSGAAPLTQEIQTALYETRKLKVKQGYGLSETSPTTHTQPWEDWQKHVGSVGKMLSNQVAKYVDAEGNEVPAGQTGELWIKGPNVFLGYLNNPEGTKNALTEDGYFKTGDVGHQDEEGNFFITDRVKELIKYKGFQVPPAELEGILMSHEDIDDVAVVGIYNKEQATEVPRAYVVPRKGVKGDKETEQKIVKWLEAKVAGHKRLRGGVGFVDAIPKTASGKILRRVLKEQAAKEGEAKAKL
jgi:acyl-CoA synthetase (AMP-forming)/AMP-acid ligase II